MRPHTRDIELTPPLSSDRGIALLGARPESPMQYPAPRSSVLPALLGALVAAVALGMPSTAAAYRTLADDPSLALTSEATLELPVTWTLSAEDLAPPDRVDAEATALRAFDAWGTPECSAVRDMYRGQTRTRASAGDGASTIEIVGAGWLARGLPDGRGATTEVQIRRDESGHAVITEADIYLNFDQHRFALRGAPTGDELDLAGVLTHEIGHLLGLAHPCEHDDSAVPSCDPTYESSALYPDYLGASQRAPSADDLAGICALYPADRCTPDCASGMTCVRGMCVDTCVGEGCEPPVPCEGSSCTAPMMCELSTDCTAGVCALVGAAEGQCVPRGSTGAECLTGDDCATGHCLTSSRLGASVCTQTC